MAGNEDFDIGGNHLKDHFENTEQNRYDVGIIPTDCQRNKKICLKNVDAGFKKQAILGILSQFGTVTDISIPSNQYKEGFVYVFATFSEFAEAEKAVREMNSEKGSWHKMTAHFAFPRRQEEPISTAKEAFDIAKEPQVDKSSYADDFDNAKPVVSSHLPIVVNISDSNDDVYEKVTEFERFKPLVTYSQKKLLDYLQKKAQESKGIVDESLTYNQELFDSLDVKSCYLCNNQALLRCDQSHLYFCSITCSRKVNEPWVDEVPLKKNEIRYDAAIKTGDHVVVTGIINEKCLYVRRANVDFGLLLNQVRKTSKGAEKLKRTPEIGDLVLAEYLDDVYRSEVIDVSRNMVTVKLIDYGNTARVSINSLMAMKAACQSLKCVTHKVYLENVNIDAINSDIIELLHNILMSKADLIVKESNQSRVELIIESTNENINNAIVQLSDVPTATNSDSGVPFNFENVPIAAGRDKKVFVVNSKPNAISPELIAIVSETDLKDFRELYRAINVYGCKQTNREEYGFARDPSWIFLAFCNEQWHRAVLLEQRGDGYPECLLIDLMSLQKISVKDMIPMPRVFASPPPLVRIGQIEGFNEDVKAHVGELFKEIIKENEFITVDEIFEDDVIILRFNSISTLLKSIDLDDSRSY